MPSGRNEARTFLYAPPVDAEIVLPRVSSSELCAMPTLALVCATKGRPYNITRRAPPWCESGVDKVLVVDASPNPVDAAAIETVCHDNGAVYVRFPPSPRDTRTKQRNLGAKVADTDWILFQDDDDDIIAEFDHAAFDAAAGGADYLWDGKGVNIEYHRRENFLRLGGYPEDMLQGWETTLSWLVKAKSRGHLEGALYRRIEPPPGTSETSQMHHLKIGALFWIGFTFMPWLERSPPDQRKNVLVHTLLFYLRLWEERDYRATAPVGLLFYTFGLLAGIPWHWVRKAYDRDFRESLRLYRQAFLRSRGTAT